MSKEEITELMLKDGFKSEIVDGIPTIYLCCNTEKLFISEVKKIKKYLRDNKYFESIRLVQKKVEV